MKSVLFKRTLLLFTVIMLLAGVLLLGAYSYFGRRTYLNLELDSLQGVMNAAAELYLARDSMFTDRANYIQSLRFMSLTADVQYYYFYVNASGKVEAFTNIPQYSNDFIQTVQFDILNGNKVRNDSLKLTPDSSAIAIGGPLIGESGLQEGGIIFVREIQYINNAFNRLNSALWFLVLCTVPISFLIATTGIHRVNKPIAEMTKVASELTNGNYDVYANEDYPGEMGILARSMNKMSDTLSQTIYQLDSEKRQLWSILSSFSEGVAALDNMGNLTHYNPALMAMFGTVDIMTPLDLIPDVQIWDAFHSVLDSKVPRTLQYTLPGEKYLWISIVPVMADDRCTGVVGLFKDMSEVEKLEKMRKEYVANISHELRTPLTAVRGLLEPLSDGMVKDEATRMRYYGIMLHQVDRLSRLITDMLQLSRLQSGTEYMEHSVFDLTELIDSVYQGYQQTALQKNIRLDLELEDLPEVVSDADRIEQVLVILLDNAIRYTDTGGSICIKVKNNNQSAIVSVWDSGCGIAPEHINHVFERFYKTDKSRKEGGTGLGLSIAKEIMDKLGESIRVESKQGEWTCFSFTVKTYISNAIQLGPVDISKAIEYNKENPFSTGDKEVSLNSDAGFEVLTQAQSKRISNKRKKQ